MGSQINTSNINRNFPEQGVDNPSQGFRDNFGNIASQLDVTANEITFLQENSNALTVATTSTLGGIIIGSGLAISNTGAVSVTNSGAMTVAKSGTVANVSEIDLTGLNFSRYHYDFEFAGQIIGGGFNGWITMQIGDSSPITNWNSTTGVFAYAYGNVGGSSDAYTANGIFGIATTRSASQSNIIGTARLRTDGTGGTNSMLVQWAGGFYEVGGTYDLAPGYNVGALKIGSTMGNFNGTYTLYAIART